jgi:hypothetical protein
VTAGRRVGAGSGVEPPICPRDTGDDVAAGFAGHGIGSRHPWVQASGPEALHPTARGYHVYAKALSRALASC